MKILIVGMGVIGTVYGWALTEAGFNVTHLIKKEKKEKYRHGVNLDIYDLRKNHIQELEQIYQPLCVLDEELKDHYDLVIIASKSFQLLDTLKQLKAQLEHAVFLTFCGYWDEIDAIDDILPRERYLLGYAASTGGFRGDTYVLNIKEKYRIGNHSGDQSNHLQWVMDIFSRSGFVADERNNMLHWLWAHQALVAGIIGAAVIGGNQNWVDNPDFRKYLVPAVREALAVVIARGVDLQDDAESMMFLQQSNEQEIITHFCQQFFETKAGQRALQYGHHIYAIDEMKKYYFDVLHTGKKLGISMPTLSLIENEFALSSLATLRMTPLFMNTPLLSGQ